MNVANECKKTAAIILRGCGISYDKLTARMEKAPLIMPGAQMVYVKVHGRRPGGAWLLAQAQARTHWFRLHD